MKIKLNALEAWVLEIHQEEPNRLFDAAELLNITHVHADALRRARNKLWRAGLIVIGCRGKSQLQSEVQDGDDAVQHSGD